MKTDLTSTINEELGDFGFSLANEVISCIGLHLNLPLKDSLVVDEALRPVIEAIGKNVIRPVLRKSLAQYGTSQAVENVCARAKEQIGAQLAEAILPDLQKPGLLTNETAFRAELTAIAEGFSAASQEEIMEVLGPIINELCNPGHHHFITHMAPIRPRSIKPDERKRILGMISEVRLSGVGGIKLVFDHRRIQPEEYELTGDCRSFIPSLRQTAQQVIRDIIGTSIELRSSGQYKKTQDTEMLYDARPLIGSFTLEELGSKIETAIRESKIPHGMSR